MNHSALLKRAFEITKRFRVLWLFGILIALTSGSSGGGSGTGYNFDASDLQRAKWPDWLPADQFQQWQQWQQQLDHFDPSRYMGLFLLCCCLLVIFALVALIIRYVARTALIRSVDQIEETSSAPTWREGFRLGWSNRAFRLWLLELIVGIGVGLAALLLLAVCASPLLLLLTHSDAVRTIGIALTVFLEVFAILVLLVAAIALSVLGQFWSREIVLRNRSIGAALASGYALVRRHLKDLGVLWLLIAGIYIGFTIVLLPVILLILVIAGLLGGGLGYVIYTIGDSIPWAVAAGLPIFMLITIVPLTFVSGLYETFMSSTWTLAYREAAQQNDV